MKKRMLITSTDLMMIQFLVPHIRNLSEHGWTIDVACSVVGNRIEEVRTALKGFAYIHIVRLHRNPLNPENLKGYGDMKKVIDSARWDLIWTNEPVMGIVTRLAARKARETGTKVVYMVHGFHFYKGAPALNWMLYYPIERWASRFADMIVTINQEDYARAKNFHAKKVEYLPGIGLDIKKYDTETDRQKLRKSLEVGENDFLLMSVGELSKRKNHKAVIKAISELNNSHIRYIICGKGPLKKILTDYVDKLGLKGKVLFLGYRKDVCQLYKAADVFLFPSIQEGLPRALMEAMASGLPVIASKIRGNTDLVTDNKGGFLVDARDSAGYAKAIESILQNSQMRTEMGNYNLKIIWEYDYAIIAQKLQTLFNMETI